MHDRSYFRFFSFGFQSYADRLIERVRKDITVRFESAFPFHAEARVLDVGVSSEDHPTSNFFEKSFPYLEKLTAVGLDPLAELERIYPGLTYVIADGRGLPFVDDAFEYAYSHAVLEHVGSRENQCRFLKELLRVSRLGAFFTTPNRAHPIELHTGLPLLHYLPAVVYRYIYGLCGKNFYATEENLNLLYRHEVQSIVKEVIGLRSIEVEEFPVRWLGVRSNIVYVLRKTDAKPY